MKFSSFLFCNQHRDARDGAGAAAAAGMTTSLIRAYCE